MRTSRPRSSAGRSPSVPRIARGPTSATVSREGERAIPARSAACPRLSSRADPPKYSDAAAETPDATLAGVSAAAIETRDLTKHYGRVRALEGRTLEAPLSGLPCVAYLLEVVERIGTNVGEETDLAIYDRLIIDNGADDTMGIDYYKVGAEAYLWDFTFGAVHTSTEPEDGEKLESDIFSASWYPIDSVRVTLSGGVEQSFPWQGGRAGANGG